MIFTLLPSCNLLVALTNHTSHLTLRQIKGLTQKANFLWSKCFARSYKMHTNGLVKAIYIKNSCKTLTIFLNGFKAV